MHLLVVCFVRFAAQWEAPCSEAISLPLDWLPINEKILTKAFDISEIISEKTASHKYQRCQCLWMQSLRMQNTFISEWAHDSNINHFLVTISYWKWVVPWKTTVVLKWFETAGLNKFFLSLYHYIHPFVVFFLQGICVCLYWWMCNPRRLSDQDEQWAVKTDNIKHVLCATCGIFIT